MPAATISSLDGAPRRIPKLAVRNRIPEAEVIDEKTSLIDTRRDSKMRPPLSSYSSEQTLSPSLVRRPSNLSQVEDGARGPSGRERSGSIASTTTQGRSQRVPTTKKKGSGVLSFLTLKEPSTSAWEEYANAQKKAASGKSSQTAQKLPAFVPATNSKWDGLPESAKRMSMQSKRDGSKTFSTFSNASKQTSRTMGTSYSDHSSETSSARSIPTTTTNTTLHSVHRNTAVTPWDEPPDLIAEDPEEEDRQSSESAQTFLHPPSPTLPELDPLSSLPTPELELPELLRPADYITTPEHSPRTPPADFALNLIDAIAQTQMDHASKPEQPQSPVLGTFWHSDTDTETESIKTGRPLSTNFSRPVLSKIPAMALIPEQSLPDEPAFEDDGEQGEEEDARAFQSTLRDATGRTSPFCFETTTLLARPAIPDRTSSQGFEGEGMGPKFSSGPKATGLTVTTAVVAGAPPLLSPTFSPRTTTAMRPTTAVTETGTETETEDETEEEREREREDTPTRLTSDLFPSYSPPRSNSDTTSLAPSEISLQWTKSPKERLGLGSRLSRIRAESEVLPWEAENALASGKRSSGMSEAQARRQSGASQMTVGEGGGGKLRRLSLRLGRKG
ncbi:hypothetical protein LTR86_005376 [Recurvomyces mirabilis]|nr:hypothetical protein LTR86_005376 [Recurvomyces mirabilis]